MRSWSNTQTATPYYPLSADKEAAKFLRLVAGRYANGQANADEVRVAFEDFNRHAKQAAQPAER